MVCDNGGNSITETIKQYAGIDVPLEYSNVGVLDADARSSMKLRDSASRSADRLVWRSRPGHGVDRSLGRPLVAVARVWRSSCRDAPCACGLQDDADNKDARGYREVDAAWLAQTGPRKSLPAQEIRVLLTARKFIQGKLHNIEMSTGGILRCFGLNVGPTVRCTFATRIQELKVIRAWRRPPLRC
ncbi:hypothetical protein GGD56_006765 [Rhizobium mongolense]|uniref:Uncharacterized protein n=1 Tax=Rhizobium mongolense TaxID=57676 RepID=A0ABR6IY75_9HYPH|nr:hypothetical protein [Rhizobium mongolense]